MMLDAIRSIKDMLKDDAIRPSQKARLQTDLKTLVSDLKELYKDLFNIIDINE